MEMPVSKSMRRMCVAMVIASHMGLEEVAFGTSRFNIARNWGVRRPIPEPVTDCILVRPIKMPDYWGDEVGGHYDTPRDGVLEEFLRKDHRLALGGVELNDNVTVHMSDGIALWRNSLTQRDLVADINRKKSVVVSKENTAKQEAVMAAIKGAYNAMLAEEPIGEITDKLLEQLRPVVNVDTIDMYKPTNRNGNR